jgi:hypothetical protein
MNYIILRPLLKDAWAGVHVYRNCHHDLAPYFTRSGQVYTGLTKEDEVRLGELLHKDLHPGADFWKNFFIRTSGKDIYLDLTDPMDELKYLFLRNNKRVANGTGDRKPTANFVLINQEEESKELNSFNRIKRQAMKEFDKMTPNEMRQCLRVFGHSAESLDNEVTEAKLSEIIEGNPQKFLDNWVNNQTRDTDYLIKSAISKNVIRKNKSIYKYGSDVIGHTLEETIDYLDDPINQDIKLAIIKEMGIKE